jgi:hypothetical protein
MAARTRRLIVLCDAGVLARPARIMPDPEFTLAPGTNNWTQDFAWDPLKDEISMTLIIRTSNGRQTIKINRLGKADDQGLRASSRR